MYILVHKKRALETLASVEHNPSADIDHSEGFSVRRFDD